MIHTVSIDERTGVIEHAARNARAGERVSPDVFEAYWPHGQVLGVYDTMDDAVSAAKAAIEAATGQPLTVVQH
jgi:hypothetical protein